MCQYQECPVYRQLNDEVNDLHGKLEQSKEARKRHKAIANDTARQLEIRMEQVKSLGRDRDEWRFLAEQRISLRDEFAEMLGVKGLGPDEQFRVGLERLRILVAAEREVAALHGEHPDMASS